MNLQEYSKAFLISKIASGRSPETVNTYDFNFRRFIEWCEQKGYTGNDLIGIIGAETVEAYLFDLSKQGLSTHTVHSRYRHLRALYRWIERRYGKTAAGDQNPFDLISEPKTQQLLPKAISHGQMEALHDSIPTDLWTGYRDRLIIRFLFYTGVRVSELVSIELDDLDLDRRLVHVTRWKTHSQDRIPLSNNLVEALAQWIAEQRPACNHSGLWPSYAGGSVGSVKKDIPLTKAGVKNMLVQRCAQANLPRFLPHSFRHGCAAYIVESGGDISLVRDVLGHKDIRTSQRYLRFDFKRTRRLYDKIFE